MISSKHFRSCAIAAMMLLTAFARTANDRFPTADGANPAWNIDQEKGECILLTPSTDVRLSLDRNKMAMARISIDVESDAKSIKLASGKTEITWEISNRMPKDGTSNIVLDFRYDYLHLFLDGEERPEFKGKCIILSKNETSNFNLELPGATYANVTIHQIAKPSNAQKAATLPSLATQPALDRQLIVDSLSPKPFPWLDVKPTVNASSLISLVRPLGEPLTHQCTTCMGRGTVEVTRIYGDATHERHVTNTETCAVCNGKGILYGIGGVAALPRACRAIAALQRDDSPTMAESKKAVAGALATLANDRTSRSNIESLLTSVTWKTPSRGTPIWGIGEIQSVMNINGKGKLFIVRVEECDLGFVIREANISDAKSGAQVIFGGLSAGTLEDSNPKNLCVLQGGFVVEIVTVYPSAQFRR